MNHLNDTAVELDFLSAMSQFTAMFPEISAQTIESVLRRHNGDVSKTIDELLDFSSRGDASASSSSLLGLPNPPPYYAVASSSAPQTTANRSAELPSKPPPNCADDEKIALLIQNREFLRYLQRDAHFMRAICGDASPRRQQHYYYDHRHNHWTPQATARPILISSSRPFSSRHNERFDEDTQRGRHHTLPDGPLVDFSDGSIPNGPLIDYPNANTSWTKKIKSRLPTVHRPSNSAPLKSEDMAGESLPEYTDERHFADRLKNMSKNSKTLFMTLAKKFTSKPDVHLRPTDYGEQYADFSRGKMH